MAVRARPAGWPACDAGGAPRADLLAPLDPGAGRRQHRAALGAGRRHRRRLPAAADPRRPARAARGGRGRRGHPGHQRVARAARRRPADRDRRRAPAAGAGRPRSCSSARPATSPWCSAGPAGDSRIADSAQYTPRLDTSERPGRRSSVTSTAGAGTAFTYTEIRRTSADGAATASPRHRRRLPGAAAGRLADLHALLPVPARPTRSTPCSWSRGRCSRRPACCCCSSRD